MAHLYRVVPAVHWHEALQTGAVPRCPADRRLDRVHLNKLEDVELVANLWFTGEEEPVVLEVDVESFGECVRWEARSDPGGVWPNLYAPAIPTKNVVRVLTLEQQLDQNGAVSFRLGPTQTAAENSHSADVTVRGAP